MTAPKLPVSDEDARRVQEAIDALGKVEAPKPAPAPAPEPPKPPSSWTPANVTIMIATIIGLLGGAAGLRDLVGASARTEAAIQASEKRMTAKLEERAKAEQTRTDEITARQSRVEQELAWTAAGLCVVSGKPLHPSQPCGLTVTTTQRGPGAEVREAYGRAP